MSKRQTRAYMRDYQRNWRNQRRESWINENGPCAECGSTTDLHIIYKTKEDRISNPRPSSIWTRRAEFRNQLLARCIVVCRPCRRIIKRSDLEDEGHSASGYRGGCRCLVCRTGHAEKQRLWRLRVKQSKPRKYRRG